MTDPVRDLERLEEETRSEIRRLLQEGLTRTAIGERLGISRATVTRILDPVSRERYRQAAREYWHRVKRLGAVLPTAEEEAVRISARKEENARRRVLSKYVPGPNNCMVWTAKTVRGGYGMTSVGGVSQVAHRVVYQILRGPIPHGLQLDHLCRNPRCGNPNHLEPVTASENQRRAKALIVKCPSGHPYSSENTGYDKKGHRYCRECHRIATRRWLAERARA